MEAVKRTMLRRIAWGLAVVGLLGLVRPVRNYVERMQGLQRIREIGLSARLVPAPIFESWVAEVHETDWIAPLCPVDGIGASGAVSEGFNPDSAPLAMFISPLNNSIFRLRME